MQTAHFSSVNYAAQWDDVIHFHSARTVFVDECDCASIYPRRHCFSSVFSARVIKKIVSGLVSGVVFVLVPLPRIDVLAVLSKVFRRALYQVNFSAILALVACASEFLIKLAARLGKAAPVAFLFGFWFRAGFHDSDIIAVAGDVKPRELREKRVTPIRSQAVQEWTEGSETRAWSPERTVKPHERAAPKGDEIVRAVRLNVQKCGIKSLHDNKLTTIQNRSGTLADNV